MPHQSLRNIIEAIPEADWTPIAYWMEGAAAVAETEYTPFQHEPEALPVRLIVRRVKPTPGSQLALFATYSYHAFITDRDGDTLDLEADPRIAIDPGHAEIENAILDLKYGVDLNHLPSGRFPANRAWLAVQVIAHNLARWTARIGLGEPVTTTKTLRRRFFSLAGRLTRKARRLTLHLPQRLALAKPVQQRSGATARLAPTFLTAPHVGRPSDQPTAWPNHDRSILECLLLPSDLWIRAKTAHWYRQHRFHLAVSLPTGRQHLVPASIVRLPRRPSPTRPALLHPFGGFGLSKQSRVTGC